MFLMMSMVADGAEIEADTLLCCASCGIAEIDGIKLKDCDGCDLVRYCSDECQDNHKSQHQEACKKRTAELRDEILFKQPESTHHGDCPICSLPLSLVLKKCTMYNCCSKIICDGCFHAIKNREVEGLRQSCPFCRESAFITDEEIGKQNMKRIEANDPVSIYQEGGKQYDKGEYRIAFEYFTKAAELGNAQAHFRLSGLYLYGEGVEKDEGKEIRHLEVAAIAGHPIARYNLGVTEWNNSNMERAVKHWIIAATQGYDNAMKELMDAFKGGFVSKEVLAAALRAHKAAVDATKSPQREAAAAARI